MKLFLMFTVLVMSSLLNYEVQGIRLGKVTLSAKIHQEIIKILPIEGGNQDYGLLAKAADFSSGIAIKERRLSSRVVTDKSHHDHWLPKIHEDYYGPRHHRPRHH